MTSIQNIEVEADSLFEARKQVKSKVPEGFEILSEKILSDGKIESIRAVADTIETAYEEALSRLPPEVEVVEKKELTAPMRKNVVAEAFDEQSAKAQIGKEISKTARVENVNLMKQGKKGFFGMGKKPNRYEFQVFEQAVVEIKYKKKARIRVMLHESPESWVQRLEKKDYHALTSLRIIKKNDSRFSRKLYDKNHDLYLTPGECGNPYGGAETEAGYPHDIQRTVQDLLKFWNTPKLSYSWKLEKKYQLDLDELRIYTIETFRDRSVCETIMYVVRLGEDAFWSWTRRAR
ncbi:hypothetical protein D4R42_05380 [bacterium]|nr:MAG: hypothetical protein D4R42_05380 [bacterium]